MTGQYIETASVQKEGQTEAPANLRRRGLIAGAAAVAAGFLAKEASQQVGAADHTSFILGETNTETSTTTLTLTGAKSSALTVNNTSGGVAGVIGNGTTFGLLGVASGTDPGPFGVYGSSTWGGVYGAGLKYGVFGNSDVAGGVGVYGQSVGTAISGNGGPTGVFGYGTSAGINGFSDRGNGVVGATSAAGLVAGVYGTSTTAYGVIGSTTASGFSGLTAITATPGVAALAATSTNANAFAAYFSGTTVVQGNFVAFGGSKSAAVPLANGEHRLVYCVEAPEAWFEDFGKGKFVGGKADVRLDAEFAAIVHADDYHVFLTEYDDNNALYVTKQTAAGFEVHAKTGTANGAFSYRVVAKRADIKGERLAKFDLPKINIPDLDKLIKPETSHVDPSTLPKPVVPRNTP